MRLPRAASAAALSTVLLAVSVPAALADDDEVAATTSQLGLTYNQDCPVDDMNTWRIRPVNVNGAVAWELRDAPGTYSGTLNPGDPESVVDAPRASTTARLFYDSDGNGSLDKETVKASGPDLSPEKNPGAFEPGGTCAEPEPTPTPTPTETPTETATETPEATEEPVPTDVPAGRPGSSDGVTSTQLAGLAALTVVGVVGATAATRARRQES
jgi:hypothetical protein